MRNHTAFQRILAYVDDNSLTWSDIRDATAAQLRAIMWPDTAGVKPDNDHATPILVKRCIKNIFRERRCEAKRQRVVDLIEASGLSVESVTVEGNRTYTIVLGEPD